MKIYDRRERADRHFRNIGIETLQEVYENVEKHYNGGRIGGTDYFTLTSLLYDAIHNERTATETCNGCRWRVKIEVDEAEFQEKRCQERKRLPKAEKEGEIE